MTFTTAILPSGREAAKGGKPKNGEVWLLFHNNIIGARWEIFPKDGKLSQKQRKVLEVFKACHNLGG